jgi:hypothetical protein
MALLNDETRALKILPREERYSQDEVLSGGVFNFDFSVQPLCFSVSLWFLLRTNI